MKIERIDSYHDPRFPQDLLYQHGCFLADGIACAFEILSDHEAVIHFQGNLELSQLIEEFRFFTPHITTFYSSDRSLIAQLPAAKIFSVDIMDIQPSQFYVDRDKIQAVSRFIRASQDIIIPVLPQDGRYIALDGHTRLYWAMLNGWETVRAVEDTSGSFIYRFVEEARRRGIFTIRDIEPADHDSYHEKWDRFCDEFFKKGS